MLSFIKNVAKIEYIINTKQNIAIIAKSFIDLFLNPPIMIQIKDKIDKIAVINVQAIFAASIGFVRFSARA